jgi:hypothetical protein
MYSLYIYPTGQFDLFSKEQIITRLIIEGKIAKELAPVSCKIFPEMVVFSSKVGFFEDRGFGIICHLKIPIHMKSELFN